MNQVIVAVEVLTGETTRLIQFDFNTGRGALQIGRAAVSLVVLFSRDDLIHFTLANKGWNVALFDDDNTVKVMDEKSPNVRHTLAGACTMRWVGTSVTDRREEPLHLHQMQNCAKAHGLTLEELLNTAL